MKRKKRYCQYCGGEFKSWHAHKDCNRDESTAQPELTTPRETEPSAHPEPKQPFRPRIMTGNTMIWMRSR